MKKEGYSIFCGIGDILVSRSMLDYYKSNESLKISPYLKLIESLKPEKAKEHISFIFDFMNLIFKTEHGYIVTEEQFPACSVIDLCTQGYKPFFLKVNKFLEDVNAPVFENYICIHTKTRSLSIREIENIKNILEFINNFNCNIVVLGEREIEKAIEYQNITVKSIYDIIISSCKNIIDLTVPKLGNTPPDINKLKTDCTIMSKAIVNINFGIGGSTCLACSCGNSIVYLPSDRQREFEFLNNIIFKNTENCERVYDVKEAKKQITKVLGK